MQQKLNFRNVNLWADAQPHEIWARFRQSVDTTVSEIFDKDRERALLHVREPRAEFRPD